MARHWERGGSCSSRHAIPNSSVSRSFCLLWCSTDFYHIRIPFIKTASREGLHDVNKYIARRARQSKGPWVLVTAAITSASVSKSATDGFSLDLGVHGVQGLRVLGFECMVVAVVLQILVEAWGPGFLSAPDILSILISVILSHTPWVLPPLINSWRINVLLVIYSP